jgi:hypothetical protein
MIISSFALTFVPQIVEEKNMTDILSELVKKSAIPTNLTYGILFLLAGGMAFLILREVFKYLKSRDSKRTEVPGEFYSGEERRAHPGGGFCVKDKAMILMIDSVKRSEIGVTETQKILLAQTEILKTANENLRTLSATNSQIVDLLKRMNFDPSRR